MEEGRVEVHKESIDVEIFLIEIMEEVHSFLKEGQKVEITNLPDLKQIETDARILRNIMFNLISNASKYSEKNKSIQITCASKDGIINFGIKDEGIGIPDSDQKHLFEQFNRASNAGNVQGTGLGLNIVKRYVDLLDGEISFTSEHGTGSTFLISIPRNS